MCILWCYNANSFTIYDTIHPRGNPWVCSHYYWTILNQNFKLKIIFLFQNCIGLTVSNIYTSLFTAQTIINKNYQDFWKFQKSRDFATETEKLFLWDPIYSKFFQMYHKSKFSKCTINLNFPKIFSFPKFLSKFKV